MPGKISSKEPIAIVGSACRFSGDANSPSKLWELLKEPRDVRREIPDTRFSAQGFHHPDHSHHGRSNVTHSYLLNEDPRAFDAEFFGVNPIEARAMDPQQRLLMETVYEALESGGMTIESLRGSDTSVFAGVMCGDYEAMLLRDLDEVPTYFAVGTSRAVLSNRISYFFDWHGASVTTDTACSSSLVAVHSAIQTLRARDSRMAVACGSNIILGPEMYIIESKLKMLSPDGLGRMWDKDANGYARGDGVAAITLKTLSAALEDNDHIECIIRETGLNQDGATAGLTMPSATAQKSLIRATYTKAGLDIDSPAGRPQYFEAHGTGTPAGDPVEAEAVSTALFDGDRVASKRQPGKDPLYVGSIKTVLGHTEGTAGVAAILKASLALQNSCIPPNLLFNNINPSVAPFYGDLQIVKDARPWPAVLSGQPRRASVNSFGFGGANAHAILESYDGSANESRGNDSTDTTLFTPFVFSAASADSLQGNLKAYAAYIDGHSEVDVGDLAYTLRERRSALPHRVSFPATNSLKDLATAIRTNLDDGEKTIGVRTLPGKAAATPKILGVFTGQGAQYARQGAELLEQSPFVRRIIQTLEADLAQLPAEDRPTWSLEAEILAGAETPSRINEAVISQPLCTAIQIVLIDLLREANIHLAAVVGHSSGEIAAAYCAGFLTARDAIYIAYYRGLHCRHAASPNGKLNGAMMAVGTSMEDALQLCEDEEFAGRINLAASNSSSSVTISGDEDAIEELEFVLEDENKFHRRLRVDMAYHSQHMEPCSIPYIESLRRAGVKAQSPTSSSTCTWYSSVHDGKPVEFSPALSDSYWAENMTKPVLFSQALKATLVANAASTFDVVLEVGPHPALMGPATQTIQEVIPEGLPYHGALSRDSNSITAFSTCLGFLWERLGGDSSRIDLGRCQRTLSDLSKAARFNVLKGLPTYQWKHDTPYWHESRRSRRIRSRKAPYHPLLGDKSPDSAAHVLRWKNILKPSKIPWLEGHQVQGQIVFPASAYLSTAVEAALSLADGKTIKLIEMSNFTIHQGLGFESRDAGIEVQIDLTRISQLRSDHMTAYYTYSAATGGVEDSELTLIADGELTIRLGDASLSLLPVRRPTAPHLLTVDPVRLYNFMESLEYNFSGPFISLVELRRKLGIASCVAKKAKASSQPDADSLLIHPVELDAAIQSVSLAYSYPGDEQLRLLHMPTTIAKIRVNPAVLALQHKQRTVDDDNTVNIDSTCNRDRRAQPGSGFSGNFNIYTNSCPNAAIQVDQVKFQPVRSSASDDRNVFYKMQYVPCEPDGTLAAADIPITKSDTDLLWAFSRIVCYYLREFDRVPEDSSVRSDATLKHYLRYARHMTTLLKNGGHRYGKVEWLNDKLEDIMAEVESKGLAENPVVKIMLLVGNTMPKVFKGETTMLEHFRTSGLLDEYYAKGFGTAQSTMWLSNVVKQITDRRPHLNLLEIGAGTGGATKQILRTIDRSFDSYTFTDISSSFFENAAENLAQWRDRMVFKVCDAEQNPGDQGFVEGQYDVVIAFLVVHATAKLDETMRNLRKLLKPGGFLLIGEGNSEGPMQAGASYIFGPLPGWWRGVDEGRTLTPFINVEEWDTILKRTGFSGIDTISPQQLLDTFGAILFVSQATDERIESIRAPLKSSTINSFAETHLAIIGGKTSEVGAVVEELENILRPCFSQTNVYATLEELENTVLDDRLSVISLTELEQPVFKNITPQRWSGFRRLFVGEKTVLWLTSGRLEDEPYANMTVGFGRSAVHEEEDLVLQLLDISDRKHVGARKIAETFARLAAKHPSDKEILYTTEPEVITDSNGRQLVPRLCSIQGANDRLNSVQRSIVHQVDTKNTEIELQGDHDHYSIRQLSRFEALKTTERPRIIELRTTKAVLSAIRTPAGQMFLVMGVNTGGSRYITLTSSLTSVVQTSEELAVPIAATKLTDDDILILTAAQLVGAAVVDALLPGQKMILHDAPEFLAQAIVSKALSKGVQVVCTTDESDGGLIPDAWVQLPPNLGSSDLGQLIPTDAASFVSFSGEEYENQHTISSVLSPYCRKENMRTLFSQTGTEHDDQSLPRIVGLLKTTVEQFKSQSQNHGLQTVSLESLARGESPEGPLAVVDWTSSSTDLPARVTRFDTRPLFRADRTYWICGLSGALGISLCDWMMGRGVRHLVLTSRNPRIDPAWIEDHKRQGANVEVLCCDVTDEAALKGVHSKIVASLPPIAGVLNGAMVLRDVSVRNMAFDQVTDVVGPKVLGSIHLDRIFHETQLDFFILLSSINCIIGNVGQANYAAANMGMCGLAAHRRKRGLAATVINVGAVIGAGYITESDRQLDAVVAKMAMIHLSEDDFHQIFAEAIEAGHVDSPDGPEISTGLLDISADSSNIPKWYSDPKFSRFIVHKSTSSGDQKRQTKAASIQDRLLACHSDVDVLQVVKEGLAAQLRAILQLSTADDDLMSMRSVDLGLDSLVSVDIRSWFLKNFEVSIPVLKIMANDVSMAALAELAAEGVPAEMTPHVGRQAQSQDGEDSGSTSDDGPNTPESETVSTAGSSETGITTPLTSTESKDLSANISARNDIDWEAEVQLPEPDRFSRMDHARTPNAKPVVVLLTGSSGLLGHHLLNGLASEPSIAKIICVAVRRLSERLKSGQLPQSDGRIVYYEGDLRLPRLGLTVEKASEIFAEVDAVIHNGSDTSHLKYYSAVRDCNVESTRELVRLCLPRKIPLHYVSSVGVCLLAGRQTFPEVSATASGIKPPADGAHGYMCSKWVCEHLLEGVNATHGLRISINRPSTIVREGNDATTAEAEFDWVNALLAYSHRIRAVPRAEHNQGAFDLVYIRSVCNDIIQEIFRSDHGNSLTYVNNVGDVVIPMSKLAEIGKTTGSGELYRTLRFDQWADEAIKAGLQPAVAALIETFDEPNTFNQATPGHGAREGKPRLRTGPGPAHPRRLASDRPSLERSGLFPWAPVLGSREPAPGGITLLTGITLPGGITLRGTTILPDGITLIDSITLCDGTILLHGITLLGGSILPDDNTLPDGTIILGGTWLPRGTVLPAGIFGPAWDKEGKEGQENEEEKEKDDDEK